MIEVNKELLELAMMSPEELEKELDLFWDELELEGRGHLFLLQKDNLMNDKDNGN